MIPIRDQNPTRSRAWITLALIAACIGVYFWVQPDPQDVMGSAEFAYERAAIPCEVTTGEPLTDVEITATFAGDDTACDLAGEEVFPDKRPWLAMLTSMFLHGGLLHLGGNMLFLWVFGNNIEDRLGRVGYLAFYLVAGVAATLTHVFLQPESTIPLVGASGAIAGVMGAYLAWFPNVRIHTLVFLGIFGFFAEISAKWLLGFWFVSQFFVGPNEGVAWAAHVGGFVFGVAGGLVMRGVSSARV